MRKIILLKLVVITLSTIQLKSQNVGISNDNAFTSPQSPLHIYWTSDGNLLQLSRSSAVNTGLIFSVSGNDFSINNRQAGNLSLWTNNTERLRINSTGTIVLPSYNPANGGILRTDNTGLVHNTNFTGTATDVLLGNGSFGSMNTLAWRLTGNSGTSPGSNFIGTTDAQDLVIRSNNQERMRIMSGGAVRIGYGTAATDALQVGGYDTTNPTVFIGSDGGSAPGFGIIRLFGTTYNTNSTIIRGGGLSFFNSGNQYVFGQTTAVDLNDFVGVVGSINYPFALNAYTTINGAGAIYGQSTGASTPGSTSFGVWGEVTSSNAIGIVGNNSSNTAGTSAARGVQGQTENPNGIGVVGINSSPTANTNAIGVLGLTNNPAGNGGYFINNASAGTNNGNGIFAVTRQSTGFGVFARNNHSSGTGLVASGNNINPIYLPAGTGGAFTGSTIGLFATKDGALAENTGAALFYASSTAFVGVYVAYRQSGTNYKIIDAGAFGGQVSTDVWGLTNDTNDRKLMFAPEAPEIVFQDFGRGKLVNGRAYIKLDPIFSRNIVVNDEHPLRVFVQLEGNCNGVYVTNKSKEGFEVIELNNGTSNVEFSWFVIANRADYINPITNQLISKHEGVRFPQAPNPPKAEVVKEKIKNREIKTPDIINEVKIEKMKNEK